MARTSPRRVPPPRPVPRPSRPRNRRQPVNQAAVSEAAESAAARARAAGARAPPPIPAADPRRRSWPPIPPRPAPSSSLDLPLCGSQVQVQAALAEAGGGDQTAQRRGGVAAWPRPQNCSPTASSTLLSSTLRGRPHPAPQPFSTHRSRSSGVRSGRCPRPGLAWATCRSALQTVDVGSPGSEVGMLPTHHRTTVAGPQVFYREAGPSEAPVVLPLHGFPGSSHMFSGGTLLARKRRDGGLHLRIPRPRPQLKRARSGTPDKEGERWRPWSRST